MSIGKETQFPFIPFYFVLEFSKEMSNQLDTKIELSLQLL